MQGEKLEIPLVFEEASNPLNDDQHTEVLENVPRESNQSPNFPLSNGRNGALADSAQENEKLSIAVGKMALDLESTKLAVPQISSRSKVLLVEDNSINLKVCSAPPAWFAKEKTYSFIRY